MGVTDLPERHFAISRANVVPEFMNFPRCHHHLAPIYFRAVPPLLLSVLLQPQAADEARFPNNEDLRHYRTMDAPRLSPDGRQVLIHVSDDTAHGGRPHVWLVEIDGKPPRQ